ncbi:MAG: DUF1801 domain-containing protein [Anaerolineae bacterium]|jgi:hypothetical protein
MAKAKTVAEYIEGLGDWRADVVSSLRRLILETAPDAKESIKWAQPVYEDNGPFCYIKAFKNHVNFGFWRGVDLPDEASMLEGSGEKMRHVKLTGLEDIHDDVLRDLVRAAVALNRSKGDPTRGS